MSDNSKKYNMDENGLCQIMETIIREVPAAASNILEDDTVQGIIEIGGDVADAVGAIQAFRKVASIPNRLFMNKFVRYCQGLTEIPLEQRQNYSRQLGKEKFNREGAFTLNVLLKIEEKEKVPFLLKLLAAKMSGQIDDDEYRRLMILAHRTLYSDLLYLKDHVTADPVALENEADYGLAASGLLVTAGNDIGTFDDVEENSMRFNYTISAKKLAHILFGTECSCLPTNLNLVKVATNEEVSEMLDDVFGPQK